MSLFLRVSPDQSQFFRGDSVSFSCGASGPWSVRRNSSGRYNQLCSDFGDVQHKSSCSLDRLFVQDSGQYWCETNSISSEPVDLTVRDRGILLQIPVRPVSVGDSVFLSCRRDSGPALPARFYRDGLLLSEQPAGHMSLQQVALSDSGLYQCESGGQRSESSRLRVHSDEKVLSSGPPPPGWTSPLAPLSPRSPLSPPSPLSPVSPLSPLSPSPLLLSSILGPVLLALLVVLVLVLLNRRTERGLSQTDPTLTSRVCYRPDTERGLRRVDPTLTSEVCYHEVTDVEEADPSVTTVQTLRNRRRNISPDQDFIAFRPGLDQD